MTIDGDAPAAITQLAAQLQAAPSWVSAGGTSADIYYERAEYDNSVSIAAVLERTNETVTRPFEGMRLIGGELQIELHYDDSVANTEELAHAIAQEVCTDIGLAQLEVASIEPAQQATEAETAGNYNLTSAIITLTYGLEP